LADIAAGKCRILAPLQPGADLPISIDPIPPA
jgi:hypothetical protein